MRAVPVKDLASVGGDGGLDHGGFPCARVFVALRWVFCLPWRSQPRRFARLRRPARRRLGAAAAADRPITWCRITSRRLTSSPCPPWMLHPQVQVVVGPPLVYAPPYAYGPPLGLWRHYYGPSPVLLRPDGTAAGWSKPALRLHSRAAQSAHAGGDLRRNHPPYIQISGFRRAGGPPCPFGP